MAEKLSLTIRLSETEREDLDAQVDLCKMNYSDYAKSKLFGLGTETEADIKSIKSAIIALRHDVKDAAASGKISSSESQNFLMALDLLSENVCTLTEELRRENDLAFQKSAEKENSSEDEQRKNEKLDAASSLVFKDPFFDD